MRVNGENDEGSSPGDSDRLGLRIVNISDGGCPDVPYLAQEMIGKTLYDTPHPQDSGAYIMWVCFGTCA